MKEIVQPEHQSSVFTEDSVVTFSLRWKELSYCTGYIISFTLCGCWIFCFYLFYFVPFIFRHVKKSARQRQKGQFELQYLRHECALLPRVFWSVFVRLSYRTAQLIHYVNYVSIRTVVVPNTWFQRIMNALRRDSLRISFVFYSNEYPPWGINEGSADPALSTSTMT